MPSSVRRRNQRGVVFPSPVVMLSVIAVAMAGIAYVATQGQEPTEREVTHGLPPGREPDARPPQALPPKKPKKLEPAVKRGKVYVEVYNNSGITGLAGRIGQQASSAGWQVVGADNWYGTIPASTVYFPPRLKRRRQGARRSTSASAACSPRSTRCASTGSTVVLTADAA